MKIVFAVSASVFLLSGCAATGGALTLSSITESVGQALRPDTDMTKFNEKLDAGTLNEAYEFAIEEAEFDEEKNELDDQLWGMQSATLMRMQGDFEQSNQYFDLIEDVMYAEDTENMIESAGETVLSTFTNDTFLDYEQSVYDSIMVNTYKALNFTALGNFDYARVEWNRSDERQRRAAEFFAEKINEKKEQQEKDAEAERKKQAEEAQAEGNAPAQSDAGGQEDIDKSYSESEKILAEQGINMSQWAAYDGYINPFATYMHGLYFLLKGEDAADLSSAIQSLERVSDITQTNVASETLSLANQVMNGDISRNNINKIFVIFENGKMAQKEEFSVKLPLFLVDDNVNYVGFALPKIEEQADQFGSIMVDGASSEVIADMDKIIKAEFKEEFPLILTKEITRTIIKVVAQKQVNDRNQYLGAATSLLAAVTTEADTRTWSMLPKNFQALMLENTGQSTISIDSQGFTQPLTVDLVPGKNNIVYVKAVNQAIAPSVQVIAI